MNREIGRDLNAYSGMQKAKKQEKVAFQSNCNALDDSNLTSDEMNESFAYLDSIGRSQVNMLKPTKTTQDAVQKYMDDPNYVENHMAFCDDLVKKGYSLEEADRITQQVFEKLSDERVYEQ